MAPRKMKQEALKPTMVKNVGVRFHTERLKAKVEKIIDKQQRIRKEQRRIRVRSREVERQCDRLKEKTEMIMKQAVKTQIKILLMFKILKARESGDSIQATKITQFLREIVAVEAANASLAEVKNKHIHCLKTAHPRRLETIRTQESIVNWEKSSDVGVHFS